MIWLVLCEHTGFKKTNKKPKLHQKKHVEAPVRHKLILLENQKGFGKAGTILAARDS